jgi:hypothetical protein
VVGCEVVVVVHIPPQSKLEYKPKLSHVVPYG